jgi:hypothetical protein
MRRSIPDHAKLAVINALSGAITVDKEIDLVGTLGWLGI